MRVFVSHAGHDHGWAEWIAWQLARADRMVAVCSAAYYEPRRWTTDEWHAALRRAKDQPGFLVPVRIDDAAPPPLLSPLLSASLHGLEVEAARVALLRALDAPGRPAVEPAFAQPRAPEAQPPVWGGVPARNEGSTGRDALLRALREGLRDGGRSVVQALHGAGRVGKTQLAAEYAWRFAADYDAVWWVRAEQPDLVGEQLAGFAVELGVVAPDAPIDAAVAALRRHCRQRGR